MKRVGPRARWLVLTVAIVIVLAAFTVGVNAFAGRGGGTRCAPQAPGVSAHDTSWRNGALRVVGCRAWRHMHHRQFHISHRSLLTGQR